MLQKELLSDVFGVSLSDNTSKVVRSSFSTPVRCLTQTVFVVASRSLDPGIGDDHCRCSQMKVSKCKDRFHPIEFNNVFCIFVILCPALCCSYIEIEVDATDLGEIWENMVRDRRVPGGFVTIVKHFHLQV